jgi:hypothetical protein|tara:strand:- start:90 stop:422 length:333 start_codon:yes stop_codon:yes gene_type:complete
MSAMKKHQLWDIVHANTEIEYSNEEGDERSLQAKSMLVSRQNPNECQVFCESESVGSMPGNSTSVFKGNITKITPRANHTNFDVNLKVGGEFQTVNVKSVKSKNNECTIS